MGLITGPTGNKLHADTLRIWPCLLLLLLSKVTWFLPLSPAVQTLKSRPLPPFPYQNETDQAIEKVDDVKKTQTKQIDLQNTLKAAGCEDGKKNLYGQDCRRLKTTLTRLNKVLRSVGKEEQTWKNQPDILPELKVNCWCPADFPPFRVVYTNIECANHVNRRIRGLDYNDQAYDDEVAIKFKTEGQKNLDTAIEKMLQKKVYTERGEVYRRYNTLIIRTTSYLMFIFALVLVIPSLLWWNISSSIWCGVNIDKTLDMIQQVQRCDTDTRRNMYQTISRKTCGVSCNKLAKSFLVCKLLVCCASLAVLFTVCHVLQPQADTLVGELAELSDIAKLYHLNDHFLFYCSFKINQLVNVQDFTVQCLTSFPHRDGLINWESTPHRNLGPAKKTMLIYGTLFQIVSAFLILHVTVNACGVLSWIWKLYLDKTCSNGTGSSTLSDNSGHEQNSEDIRFFLCVVHEQLGHVVSSELAESFTPTIQAPDNSLAFSGSREKRRV